MRNSVSAMVFAIVSILIYGCDEQDRGGPKNNPQPDTALSPRTEYASDSGISVVTSVIREERVLPAIPDSASPQSLSEIVASETRGIDSIIVGSLKVSTSDVDRLINPAGLRASKLNCSGMTAKDMESAKEFVYILSADYAAKAGFIASAEAYIGKRLYIYDMVFWKDHIVEEKTVGRCETGVRMLVAIDDSKASGNVSLPYIAASVQTNSLEASASFETIGMSGDLVAKTLPAFSGSYDIAMHVRFVEAVENMKKLVFNDSVKITPQYVAMVRIEDTEYERALVVAHALNSIADGDSRNESISELKNPNNAYAVSVINEVYQARCGSGEEPNDVCKAKARLLFTRTGTDWNW